ncbi:hypothetical protein [Streptomyces endophyticus]|uniref:Uncharacterized protein n=1 Tax=Streptomyces endophyticus TaxID=714166 RepID=A0ABU6F391_9ACTN|nr:hypothetical protein [Streptomyces endophyticus]MEB8337287.1 hypothetical protein [Streptomyces endophyticus]
MTDTTIDRYIGLSARAVHDDSALEELLTCSPLTRSSEQGLTQDLF